MTNQRRVEHKAARYRGWGDPVEFMLSAGNDHDSVHAVELLKKVKISGSNVLADRAYGAKTIRAYISEQGASYVIPHRAMFLIRGL